MHSQTVRILGLDPGLQRTGYGIIEVRGINLTYIAHGVITSSQKDDLAKRLADLHKGISDIIHDFTPCEAVVEEIFVNVNPTTTLRLGMARGMALMTPALHHIPVFEYTANRIKKSVVGAGHCSKDQMIAMIARLLPQSVVAQTPLTSDAADALAGAICHAHFRLTHAYKYGT